MLWILKNSHIHCCYRCARLMHALDQCVRLTNVCARPMHTLDQCVRRTNACAVPIRAPDQCVSCTNACGVNACAWLMPTFLPMRALYHACALPVRVQDQCVHCANACDEPVRAVPMRSPDQYVRCASVRWTSACTMPMWALDQCVCWTNACVKIIGFGYTFTVLCPLFCSPSVSVVSNTCILCSSVAMWSYLTHISVYCVLFKSAFPFVFIPISIWETIFTRTAAVKSRYIQAQIDKELTHWPSLFFITNRQTTSRSRYFSADPTLIIQI